MATYQELSDFLSGVERRAYKHALFAVRDEHTALDLVQDAMLKLAEKYAMRPCQELPMLFQRILQNVIRDHFRRQKVRSLWIKPLSALSPNQDDDDQDPLESLRADNVAGPMEALAQTRVFAAIERALQSLPARQREAFLLRYWEDMDVAETAAVMGCSAGSVKTHCSRATHTLATILKQKGITL
ncbi:MAG: RNA polymerase sigma factor [Pseudomonadota bacterium]|nr:RNA polymerase sigma factor [Pseudomonadota bacterium]